MIFVIIVVSSYFALRGESPFRSLVDEDLLDAIAELFDGPMFVVVNESVMLFLSAMFSPQPSQPITSLLCSVELLISHDFTQC